MRDDRKAEGPDIVDVLCATIFRRGLFLGGAAGFVLGFAVGVGMTLGVGQ